VEDSLLSCRINVIVSPFCLLHVFRISIVTSVSLLRLVVTSATNLVLTQKNVEGKLEGVDPTQEGKDHAKDPTNLYESI
jgi:hypothetical protein